MIRQSISRRRFLAHTSVAAAGLTLVGSSPLIAECVQSRIPGLSAAHYLTDSVDPQVLRELATAAITAAKGAGAAYADIRIGSVQGLEVSTSNGKRFTISIEDDIAYGVRVLAEKGWGFVHGTRLTPDAVTAAARGAVMRARQNGAIVQVNTRPQAGHDWVSAPVAVGEWSVPVQIDPFEVSLEEQTALLASWVNTTPRTWFVAGRTGLHWQRETRVFASMEGSLTTQYLLRSDPYIAITTDRRMGGGLVGMSVPHIVAGSGGFETVAGAWVHEQIKATAEELSQYSYLPAKPMDIGRYPVVFDGATLGMTLYRSLGQSLEMDRVRGDEADASGTSLLAPPEEFLGASIASSVLTVRADRSNPTVTSAKWDDEGVEPQSGIVIDEGHLVDYQTSRGTAGMLAAWYQRRGKPVASFGSAIAPTAGAPVQIRCGHLTVQPATGNVTIDDLIRDMSHGLLVRNGSVTGSDRQLSSGAVSDGMALIFEVERGRVVRRVLGTQLEWTSRALWNAMSAVGDATTVMHTSDRIDKGQPWWPCLNNTTAPAAYFKSVNVTDTNRRV